MKIHIGKSQSELPLVPEDLDPYQRVYICTHGWKERVRSKGYRPRQTVKGVGCPMRFRAQCVQRSDGKWCIEVKQPFYGHTHSLSEETYRVYPSVRQVPKDSPIMNDVELMVASGSKASRIYDYIRERTPHYVQLKDVHNLIARIKNSGGSLSDEDLVAELLVSFELESPGNVAAVDEDTEGHTAVVAISSQHMRKLYKRFPEILLVDCTHKTNRYNYQLCTLMVMDQFGHGQAVQHSVLERNADWHMEKAVEQFQLANDWKRTKVIMVDKDLTEIGVLRAKFPDARILLCQFHVLKWLRGAVRDDKKYDTYPSDILKQMDHCVANMVYAKSDDEFDQHTAEFKHLSCRDGRNSLWAYFGKNWVECKEMWVTLYRMHLPHFRNNTYNRLESFFGKLKADLDSSMSMRECLEATIRYQRRKEDEYATRVIMPGTCRDITLDDEMNQLLGMTSEWVAEVFEPEYKFALDLNSAKMYIIDDEDLYVNFTRDGHKYRVDKYNWMCTCEFSSTMKLPCRHGMVYRKHVAHMLTIPYSSIPVRWLRVGSLDEEIAAVDVPLRISSARVDGVPKKRMTERYKFKAAQSVFNRLTTELSDLPDHKFVAALDNLERWRGRLRLGDVTMETPYNSEESNEAMAPTEDAGEGTAADEEEKDENVHEDKAAEGTGVTEDKNMEKAEGKSLKLKPFNPRTRVGRPQKDRAAEAAKRRQSRKDYNHGTKLRGALRGDDLVEVAEFIKTCEPPLSDLSSFLNTFEVRHLRVRPKELSVNWRVPESSVVPHRLPESMVSEGLRLIESKRPFGEPIDLCTPVDTTVECWVLTVDSIGDFTHQQLLAMQYVWNLVHTSEKA